MSQNKIDFNAITQGDKNQFILIKKLIIELQQNINSVTDIDLLSNIIKMGNIAELAVKGFLRVTGITFQREPFFILIGKDFLDGKYLLISTKHLPFTPDLCNMYNQRNLAQHGGVLPNVSNLQDWFKKLEQFINIVFVELFGKDFREINLSALIKHPIRKQKYEEFASLISLKNWEAAILKGKNVYLELIERYVQNHSYFIFSQYQKFYNDKNIFEALEVLARRDNTNSLRINDNDYWTITTKYLKLLASSNVTEAEYQEQIMIIQEKLLDLMIRLDSINEEHEISEKTVLFDGKEVSMQIVRYDKKDGINSDLFITGVSNDLTNLTMIVDLLRENKKEIVEISGYLPSNFKAKVVDYCCKQISHIAAFRYYIYLTGSISSPT